MRSFPPLKAAHNVRSARRVGRSVFVRAQVDLFQGPQGNQPSSRAAHSHGFFFPFFPSLLSLFLSIEQHSSMDVDGRIHQAFFSISATFYPPFSLSHYLLSLDDFLFHHQKLGWITNATDTRRNSGEGNRPRGSLFSAPQTASLVRLVPAEGSILGARAILTFLFRVVSIPSV